VSKRKGSALVLMLAVITLFIVLSVSVLTVSTSAFKSNIAYDRINQVRLLAESGVDQAIAQIKNSSNLAVPVITSADNVMTCNVTITANTPVTGQYKIVSKASGGGYSKTLTVVYQKTGLGGAGGGGTPEQVADLVNDYLLKNTVSLFVTSPTDTVFTWPPRNGNSANNEINIIGNMYFSGYNINFTPTEYYLNGNVVFQGDTSIIQQTKNNFGTLTGTVTQTTAVPPDIHPVIDTNSLNKVVLFTSGTYNLLGYTTNQNASLSNINQIIYNSAYKNYANDNNVYKVVVVDGDLTIYKGTYYNYIIYCTGRIYIQGDGTNNDNNVVKMYNTSICANRGLEFLNKVNLTIDNSQGIPAGSSGPISTYLGTILTKPGDGGIVDWQE
jgi:hypothetical protein